MCNNSSLGLQIKIDILASSLWFELMICNSDINEALSWLKIIEIHHKTSRGYRQDLTRAAIQKDFWKWLRWSEKDFINNASTGDILLFKGKSFFSKFLRFITGGEYDHVGLLFKFGDKLVLFESTRTLGVNLLDWKLFIRNKYHKFYSKLAYRKLHYDLSENEIEALETFAETVKGK